MLSRIEKMISMLLQLCEAVLKRALELLSRHEGVGWPLCTGFRSRSSPPCVYDACNPYVGIHSPPGDGG